MAGIWFTFRNTIQFSFWISKLKIWRGQKGERANNVAACKYNMIGGSDACTSEDWHLPECCVLSRSTQLPAFRRSDVSPFSVLKSPREALNMVFRNVDKHSPVQGVNGLASTTRNSYAAWDSRRRYYDPLKLRLYQPTPPNFPPHLNIRDDVEERSANGELSGYFPVPRKTLKVELVLLIRQWLHIFIVYLECYYVVWIRKTN
jgi:hypothetical protein